MIKIYVLLLLIMVAIVLGMLIFLFKGPTLYDKLNAVFVMNTNIIFLIMIIGFIDGRMNMYIDIALSYSVLGFVTTVILAKFIGGHK